MRLTIIGCSGSFAGPNSPASSYLVQSEHEGRTWNLVLDMGPGSLGALQRHIELDAIDAIVISHLHPDHCLDLTGLFRHVAPCRACRSTARRTPPRACPARTG